MQNIYLVVDSNEDVLIINQPLEEPFSEKYPILEAWFSRQLIGFIQVMMQAGCILEFKYPVSCQGIPTWLSTSYNFSPAGSILIVLDGNEKWYSKRYCQGYYDKAIAKTLASYN